jgi:hypothetical protein
MLSGDPVFEFEAFTRGKLTASTRPVQASKLRGRASRWHCVDAFLQDEPQDEPTAIPSPQLCVNGC